MKVLNSLKLKDVFYEFVHTRKTSFEELEYTARHMGYLLVGIKFPNDHVYKDRPPSPAYLIVEHGQTKDIFSEPKAKYTQELLESSFISY